MNDKNNYISGEDDMPKLLIVEDDADIVENLSVLLENEGFSVCHAPDVKGALNKLRTENIDLVLLDITLPDGNGYSICTSVKRATNAPVIFLTAMTDESSIITGFQLICFLSFQQPISYITNFNSFIKIFRMPGSGNEHFGVCISNLKQRRTFSLKGFLSRDVITHLNVYFLASSLSNKVNFFLI